MEGQTTLLRSHIESVDGWIVYATAEHRKVHLPVNQEHEELREEMMKERRAEEEGKGRSERS